MYVRSLRVAGFKSFADPTVLEFEPGVNIIVGPNGSGKSNIADALSWVLGSQAPSNLRGGVMEDVVFAGSAGRPSLGRAEVELTLDNASRTLPLDVPEVAISRFTDRSGASEYRINGSICRLLDISELLSDTGIGRSLHALVGQGELDEVLQAQPEERRSFIEEAAQVGKHRRRRQRALNKIERVEDNLMRLNDVVVEVRRAVRPLKRQASAAAAYSELMAEHRDLKQRVTATELRGLDEGASEQEVEAQVHRAGLLADELESVRARLAGAGVNRQELASSAERARKVAYSMGRATDAIKGLGRLAQERAALISARLVAETEQGYRERIRLLELDRKRWEAALQELSRPSQEAKNRAAQARTYADAQRSAHASAEERLGELRVEETKAAQELVRAEGSVAASRATIGSIDARVQAVLERRHVTAGELAEVEQTVSLAEKESRALEEDLERVARAAGEAEARLQQEAERAEKTKRALEGSRSQSAAGRARLEALNDVARVLADIPQATSRLEPLLKEAQEGARLAAEGEAGAARLVKDADSALKTHMDALARQDDELRRVDALISGAAERLAGARRQREAKEIELSALDEELARARDALAEAETAGAEVRAALPGHRAALEKARRARMEAEDQATVARDHAGRAGQRAWDAEMEARAAEERALAASLRLEEAEGGIADARAALAGLKGARAALQESRRRCEVLAGLAAQAAARGERWTAEAEAKAQRAGAEAEAVERHLDELRARERELEQSLGEVGRRRNQAEVRRAEMRARAEALAERAMDEWGLTLSDLFELTPLTAEEAGRARLRMAELDREVSRLGPVNPRAAEEYEEAEKRHSFLLGQIEDLQASKKDLLKVVKEVDATIVEVFGKAFEDVSREFQATLERLFPGGSGALKLTDPGDLLTAGIEIEARPAGKNVKKLSLLSGGERALVALAFLFSIFRARPSPFYLLDEVEAALDDVNLQRFLGLVGDLRGRAQVLFITHQKRTMETADVLYGVTMAKDGVSRVVARRLQPDAAGAAQTAQEERAGAGSFGPTAA